MARTFGRHLQLNELGELVKATMHARGDTLKKLALAVEEHENTLRRMLSGKSGRRMRARVLTKLAGYCDITVAAAEAMLDSDAVNGTTSCDASA